MQRTGGVRRLGWLVPLVLVLLAAAVWLGQPLHGLFDRSPRPYEPSDWPAAGYTYAPAAWTGDYWLSAYLLADQELLIPVSHPRGDGEEAAHPLLELETLLRAWFALADEEPPAAGLRHPLTGNPQLLQGTLDGLAPPFDLLLRLDALPVSLDPRLRPPPPGLRALHFLLASQSHAPVKRLAFYASPEPGEDPVQIGQDQVVRSGAVVNHAAPADDDAPDEEAEEAVEELVAYLPVAAGNRLVLAPFALGPETSAAAWFNRVLRQYSAEVQGLSPVSAFFHGTPRLSLSVDDRLATVTLSTRLGGEIVQDEAAVSVFLDSLAASLLAHPQVDRAAFNLTGEPDGLLSEAVTRLPDTVSLGWPNPLFPADD